MGAIPANARRACTKVISSDPKSAEAYNNRCFANNELQQYDKSLIDCNVAIKLDAEKRLRLQQPRRRL